MELVCEECRDWPPPKRRVFVNYNNSLRIKREYKQRQARLAGAASDQSVCDTDTDVRLDEPSVPVQNVPFDALGQQQCLVSEEVPTRLLVLCHPFGTFLVRVCCWVILPCLPIWLYRRPQHGRGGNRKNYYF